SPNRPALQGSAIETGSPQRTDLPAQSSRMPTDRRTRSEWPEHAAEPAGPGLILAARGSMRRISRSHGHDASKARLAPGEMTPTRDAERPRMGRVGGPLWHAAEHRARRRPARPGVRQTGAAPQRGAWLSHLNAYFTPSGLLVTNGRTLLPRYRRHKPD